MAAPKIFISHSIDKAKNEEIELLSELNDRLEKEGFEVLLDVARLNEDLGGRWRLTLNTWIELCDAAIIIFNDRARDKSNWVVYESAILSWRKGQQEDFLLIPLLVPPIKSADLKAGRFAPHHLSELQAIRADNPSWCDKVVSQLANLKARLQNLSLSPALKVENGLTTLLQEISDEGAIIRAAGQLGVDLGRWQRNVDKRRALARLLLQAELTAACQAVRAHLTSLSIDRLVTIREYLAPGWITYQSAEMIGQVARASKPEQRFLAVNTEKLQTLKMYLRRASGLPADRSWSSIDVNPPMTSVSPVRHWVAEIVGDLKNCLGWEEEEIKQLLNDTSSDEPVFILFYFSGKLPERSDLDKLRNEFRAITIFVPTGSAKPTVDGPPIPGARFLEPALDAEEESQFYRRYRVATLVTSGGMSKVSTKSGIRVGGSCLR